MRKYILLVFMLLPSIALMAQEITGRVISESGESVSFANVVLRERNIGIVSDINGHYRLPAHILEERADTLVFSSIGFDTKRVPVSVFAARVAAGNTTIVLTPNYALLPEFTVTPRRAVDYGLFNLRRGTAVLYGRPTRKLMVFVENTANEVKLITTVNVRMRDHRDIGIEKMRVFFYQRTENGFQNIRVADEDIFITDFSQERIRHDVSELFIPFPAEGIFVGLELIGQDNVVHDRTEDQSQNIGLGISSTTRERGSFTYVLDENDNWIDMQETIVVENYPRRIQHLVRNLNAVVGITAH